MFALLYWKESDLSQVWVLTGENGSVWTFDRYSEAENTAHKMNEQKGISYTRIISIEETEEP